MGMFRRMRQPHVYYRLGGELRSCSFIISGLWILHPDHIQSFLLFLSQESVRVATWWSTLTKQSGREGMCLMGYVPGTSTTVHLPYVLKILYFRCYMANGRIDNLALQALLQAKYIAHDAFPHTKLLKDTKR